MAGALPFIRDGLDQEQPTLVAVGAAKIALLREALDGQPDSLHFVDMAAIGANPARIIPAWRAFVDARPAGRGARGIGEPIWAERTAAELAECQRHEALLNLAFADTDSFELLCPYDTERLSDDVIDEARRSHPLVIDGGVATGSTSYAGLERAREPFRHQLSPAPAGAPELRFAAAELAEVRRFVTDQAARLLAPDRLADLLLAVNELAANSLRHGGGSGLVRVWREPGMLVCEVCDQGRIEHPLAGREPPAADQAGGFGLWMVNQLCDLVQVRVLDDGGVVRVHMRTGVR